MKHGKEIDEARAGDPYWVECVGGPFDGRMFQLSWDRLKLTDGRVVVARGFVVEGSTERLPDGTVRRGGGQGHYVEDGWADENSRSFA